jgi:hypothetical protein
MKKESLKLSFHIIVLILSIVLFSSPKIYGANLKGRVAYRRTNKKARIHPKTCFVTRSSEKSVVKAGGEKGSEACRCTSRTFFTDNADPRALQPSAVERGFRMGSTSPSSFRRDMPFGEAIDILRNSTIPPLNIAVLWKDLAENAGINRETPIGTDGLSGVPLRTHLKVLLMSVSVGAIERIRYVVDGNVIIIATQSSLPSRRVTRIYDVSDLVAEPANYGRIGRMLGMQNMMRGGMMQGGMMGGGSMLGGSGFGRQGFLGSGPYRSTGRAYIGAGSTQTNRNSSYYASGNFGAYRSRELVNLIETLYGSNR